jgi:glycosyltransferase involved in cell wall biosynthesis
MRLAVATANWPHPAHTVRGANVLAFELIRALAAQPDLSVGFLKVGREGDEEPSAMEREGLALLREAGAEVLPPITLRARSRIGNTFSKLVAPRVEHFFPDVMHGPAIANALEKWCPDALLVALSEWLTAACSTVPVTRFAYYGNPDPKSARFRADHDLTLGGSALTYARLRVALSRMEKAHLEVMRRYHLLGDVAENDAAYYSASGHPNAFYIRHVWIDRVGEDWRQRRDATECHDPLVIVGSVGRLEATGNRLGIEYLGRELLPALRRRMKPGSFRVEIFGAAKLHPRIAQHLNGPDVLVRGFVPDIDAAILSAPVFLCTNNATPFKVGHTRYLLAWSLGACVVAHRDAALSMPEIIDGQTALLGDDAEGLADAIARAAADRALCRKIGEGGWETYRTLFRAESVAPEIVERLRTEHAKHRGAGGAK